MIKVGILGCASIAKKSLIPAFAEHADFELAFIGSRDKKKAEEIAKSCACACDFGTYEDATNSNVDLVYIPLPNALHFEWTTNALAAGKHVLCEKSLGVSLSEVKEMVGLAEQNNLLLLESFQWRFHAQTQEVREIVNSGVLGDIRCFRSSFGFPPFPDGTANIRYKKELGGGALLDAGAYTVKAATEMLGADFTVKASSLRHEKNCDVDVGGAAFLENSKGVVAEVAFGFDNYYQCNYEFWGSKGKLTVNRAFTAPPGFTPTAVLETASGVKTMQLSQDNAFIKLLDYASNILYTNDQRLMAEENKNNLVQSTLLNRMLDLSNG